MRHKTVGIGSGRAAGVSCAEVFSGFNPDGRECVGLTEIALEAARDSSFPYDCFGFLMRQGHILREASRHAHQGGAFVR